MMLSLWLPDFILITTHTNINIISIGPNIGPKNVEVLALNNPLFFYSFFLHSLSLFCSDAFFLKCRPRHDPLSSKRQDREGGEKGEAGNTTHAHPPTHLHQHPLHRGKTRGGGGEGVGLNFLSFFSQGWRCIYIYYTYVHMMRKWFHLNIWRPYLHLPHLNIYFWSKF